MSPLVLRLLMAIFDYIVYGINKCIKNRVIKYPFIALMTLLTLSIYGFVGYICYRLWTDSNSVYLENWFLYFLLLLGFHAIVFEAFYIAVSYYYVRNEF